jgi:tetratricopeptide (TPR) repeat protein
MSKFCSPTGLGFIAAIVLATTYFSHEAVAKTCEKPVAVAVSVQGEVNARKGGAVYWEPVRRKDAFCPGDAVRVMAQSRADFLLINETTLRLDQNTEIVFTPPEREKEFWLDVLLGGTYFMSRTPRTFRVHTPFVNAGIEGTEFFIGVEKDRALLTVFEGRVAAAKDRGEVAVSRGQSVVAEAGRAPVLRTEVKPRDAVRWTLFYPVVSATRPGAPSGWQDRAANLLAVGRVDEASAEIEEVLKTSPGNADALSLQAVIAVAQNERGKALDLAKKAVAAAPDSATALVALSYAQQADFDLEGALASLREAVKKEPGNALARARLSEILLSFGFLDEALDEAKKAAALPPEIARTQTVLGFAYLAQIRTKESRAAFEKAIGLDQADPLPRLGMGLATIRDGDVEEGRKEIEIAASLDPNNSLIRSYLGKAYYEEKRGKTAATQFTMAKELDPNDPTPYFYDAILKQSANRPVEALHDLQKSISLNDDRAVYRSRLLLDEDLAARSANLGRIYDDLGFQQLALVEGWKSVNTDPANFSAHRFLADSYAALPRHEIARVSELLQSQLLQPISINPVQPRLAQNNILILEGAGPSSPSFNEFNPLFNRNRLALQASGVAGSQGTWGDEVAFSGLKNRYSFSIGQYHSETDGFRENNDLKQNIYNVFTQASLSYKTSVLAEFRSFDTEHGDLEMRFNPDNFYNNLKQYNKYRNGRIGFHHAFVPGSDLIGTMVYEYNRFNSQLTDSFPFPVPPPGFVLESDIQRQVDEHTFGLEVQQQFRRVRYNLVTGAGFLHVDRSTSDDTSLIPNPPQDPLLFPPIAFSTSQESTIGHTNAYLYSYVRWPDQVTWTIGASADFYIVSGATNPDQSKFNPKFGVTWTPLPGTTIRAAAFRVFRGDYPFTNQTIEPTQVAGFNQFYADAGGTESWQYGIAIDQKITDNLFAGAEYSHRDLDVPTEVLVPPAPASIQILDWKERLGHAYSYWTPHPWFALSADYLYQKFDRDGDLAPEVKTQRVPMAIRFFHPCGAMAMFKGTYFDQEGTFFLIGQSPSTDTPESGEDRFWIFDASVGYRFPKRYGIASVEVRNLFDRQFQYQDTDPFNPVVWPERSVLFKITLSI